MLNFFKIAIGFIIAASFLVSVYFYPLMPDVIASHWGADGQVDGYMGKFWGLFLMPTISLVMFLLFVFLPKIDPLKENIKKFRKEFDVFLLIIFLFMFYLHGLTIAWNMGARFNMGQFMAPFMGILFFAAGVLMESSKMNWFIGIKTPWTLSSEKVWNKTHKLGGMLFKISGIFAILGFVFPEYAIWLIIVPVIVSSIYSILYSYLEYRKEKNI